ncbi:hypothetical protein [Candidatus Absconditicoccus praedator]|uniref:hypothetical protein n=1 Tax=Candidatus Absconditicoccus praedator TaxID=2735562 RepID=UPI001E5E1A30|nr:hypothetical protein [Candidatus Absconditicoccus praedator]UFX82714.1 hypothetical protein HLG78_01000 [Candidatus Absconditicoccus praedator]
MVENFSDRLDDLEARSGELPEGERDSFESDVNSLREDYESIEESEREGELERIEEEYENLKEQVEQEERQEVEEVLSECGGELEELCDEIELRNMIQSGLRVERVSNSGNDSVESDSSSDSKSQGDGREVSGVEGFVRGLGDIGNFIADLIWGDKESAESGEVGQNEKISKLLLEKGFSDSEPNIKSTLNKIDAIPFESVYGKLNNDAYSIDDLVVEIINDLSEQDEPQNLNPDERAFLNRYLTLIRVNYDYISDNVTDMDDETSFSDINAVLFETENSVNKASFNEGAKLLDWTDYEESSDEEVEAGEEVDGEVDINSYESFQNLSIEQIENLTVQEILDIRYFSLQNSIRNSGTSLPINITYFEDSDKQAALESRAQENGIELPGHINFNENYQLEVGDNNYVVEYKWNSLNPLGGRDWHEAKPDDGYTMEFSNNNGDIIISGSAAGSSLEYTIDSDEFVDVVYSLLKNGNSELNGVDIHDRMGDRFKFRQA